MEESLYSQFFATLGICPKLCYNIFVFWFEVTALFHWLLFPATIHGKGVYFAVDPTYSAKSTYAVPDANGNIHVYQCRVLSGHYTQSSSNYILPPSKDPNHPNIRYDSVVDNPASPSIFVIFNDTQAYPQYLVTLQHFFS